ncbi:alpha-mannosidase [Oscillospiraceae bacterium HV4-5-C5C]|nr:alpha-mannosidase [Oscillospiraceae bacterium HV4-5-C5C]
MKMKAEWRDRLKHWAYTLTQDFYLPLGDLSFEGFFTFDELSLSDALAHPAKPIAEGTDWGEEWEYGWFKTAITLPHAAQGKMIVLNLNTGGESTVFVDGQAFGTRRAEWVAVPHHYIEDNFVTQSGEAGRQYDIVLETYAGHFYPESPLGGCAVGPVMPGAYQDPLKGKNRTKVGHSTFGIWNEVAYQLWMDVTTLNEVMQNLPDGSLRAAKIAAALQRFTLTVDFEQPLEQRLASYEAGREMLKSALACQNGSTSPTFYAIGNSHLDVVWLWPFQETIRKTARTFAQQLRLLDKYPDYRYLQSQPQTYQMCKEHYPELYSRIKQSIRAGRWIAEGAMWVEPDTNMTSGESLIRQLLYGMKFYKEELGVDCEILWLPDTFGYSAALPQILKSFGIKYLVTQKIFWSYNEGEQFPYHYFTWEGNDGTDISAFLPTSYTYRTNPDELMKLWDNRVQKDELDKFLLPFGYGDGGGGPTRDYIEFARRQADLEGAPKVELATPNKLFKDLEAEGGPQHKYTGELYFSAHRGVYTSQASVKWGNRRSELTLREAELWTALAALDQKTDYPAAEFEALWKKVLLNQFHDILPGSSIARVYKEAKVLHDEVIRRGSELAQSAAVSLTASADDAAAVTIFNSLSFSRVERVALPERFKQGARTAEGETVATETDAAGQVFAQVTLPPVSATVLVPAEQPASQPVPGVSLTRTADTRLVLENEWLRAEIDQNGEIPSFTLKESGREFAASPLNHFLLYKDVPRLFDAWDIDSNYEQQEISLEPAAKVTVLSQSSLQAVIRVTKTIGNSELEQDIILNAGSRRLEFKTTVNWKELHRLLKVSFPLDIYATEALNEIQFGYVRRPTHRSRQFEQDRFEVCNHRYTALCDSSHGAAVLNDCKYGISMLGNCLNLTLLKAAGSPELRADNRVHHFTYALTAWEGAFESSPAVAEGYALNVAPLCVPGGSHSRNFMTVSDPAVVVDTVKLAEDGSGDLIVRLYEAKGGDRQVKLTLPAAHGLVSSCLMNEQPVAEAALLEDSDPGVSLCFRPFEVKTLRVRSN